MWDRHLDTASERATNAVGRALAPFLEAGDVLLLSGDLGAGKTCLARGIAEGLGVGQPITSPTFNILVVHPGRIPLYHFDLYRLDESQQLEDVDYWGTLEADGVSVVEWGDRFADAIPADCITVIITMTGDNDRHLRLQPRGERSTQLADLWVAECRGLPEVRVDAAVES